MIDFLCIGAQKAGTTWLMGNLSKHPEIWTPRFTKEIHYFDRIHLGYHRDTLGIYRKRCAGLVARNPGFARYFSKVVDPGFAFTDEWYRHIFSRAPESKKKGECTPAYCALPEEGVRHVQRLAPEVLIIYMIRNPLERALSSLRMEMNFHKVRLSARLESRIRKPLFAARGRYSVNIPRWESVFGPDRILFLPFGDIRSHPEEVMSRVEDHLQIEPFGAYPRLGDRINKTNREQLEITEDTLTLLREIVNGEESYLRNRFGQEFLDRTH